ncbi:MAG: 3-phosphoshikimate 1-carboxyvinyltransferase [Candidatus Omnitrophica bacterium]|nr:3-phosphoshikimate 1-carboxyvinyltransferase [Candidatus Omnitrophota bacterium]
MDAFLRQSSTLTGTLTVPPDKAITHRALLLASVLEGVTEVAPWSAADDCRRTLEMVEGLGVGVERVGGVVRVTGRGLQGLRAPAADLWCGESGTTMRLSCGLLAGQPFRARLTASPSLCRRPMRRVAEPLTRMGAEIQGTGTALDLHPPLSIHGRRPLTAITYRPPVASAQVKSAVLLAGLWADGPTTVDELAPTRDHTERLLAHLGVPVTRRDLSVTIAPVTRPLPSPGRLTIPGDPSSAAFLIVAAAIVPDARLVLRDIGLNPTRMHFLQVLQRMGASVEWKVEEDGWEPRGTITVTSSRLTGVTVPAREIPLVIDELPILMAAACAADGVTMFEEVGELKVKETDRQHSMAEGLSRLGASVTAHGRSGIAVASSRLRGAVVESYGDHRTAMSLAVAGLLAEGETRIRGAECVSKSFGDFFEVLASVAAPGAVRCEVDKP